MAAQATGLSVGMVYWLFFFVTLPQVEVVKYCDDSVCLFVCLSVGISLELHLWSSPDFSAHVTCGCGSVLLWQLHGTLCTSGFMDDVIFAHNVS